jgi:hypothetical protein
MIKVKDVIEYLKEFDPETPFVVNSSEIGNLSITKEQLKQCIILDYIDFLDDKECDEFKCVIFGA